MEQIKEYEYTTLEQNLETGDLKFESKYTNFEQRVIEYAHGNNTYKAIVRLTGNDTHSYGSLWFPELPGKQTSQDISAHKELLKRAKIIEGQEHIEWPTTNIDFDFRIVGWGNDQINSRKYDAKFLKERINIDNLPELAKAVIAYNSKKSKWKKIVHFLGAGFRPFQVDNMVNKWVYGVGIIEDIKTIQDIEERELKKTHENVGIYRDISLDSPLSGLAWVLPQYRAGLSFTFEGPKDELEERISAFLGEIPARRIKRSEQIEFEQEEFQKKIASQIKEIRKGKMCWYCKEDFIKGDIKIQGELHTQLGAQEICVEADLHQSCHEEYQQERESNSKQVRRPLKEKT